MDGSFMQDAAVFVEGTVKSFDIGAGKGLIARENAQDVVVTRAAIKFDGPRTLTVGDRVSFQLVAGLNGPCAASVKRL